MNPSPTYTVTELNAMIRDLFEDTPALHNIWITGEISNMTRASSGHWYFTVKDDDSQLRCVMFRSQAKFQTLQPENGDAVSVHGRVRVYEARGEYQLYANKIEPLGGVGDLYRRFEELKAKLQAEGLFDEDRKRSIPSIPKTIGVVTSPTTAAFQDIQNVLRRRFPMVEVILSPTLVQGNEAPAQIVRAIQRLNQHTDVDAILLSRGGGSIEDLWCFNDEQVARAVAESRIPIVTGVGHEIDFTIVDFVSDLRAPTPSAGAEVITPNQDDLLLDLERHNETLERFIQDRLVSTQNELSQLERSLTRNSPETDILAVRQRIDEWTARLSSASQRHLALLRERLVARQSALQAANPEAILGRGYAIVTRSKDGTRVQSDNDVKTGDGVTIRLKDGEIVARVEDKDTHEQYKRTLL